MKRTAGNRKSDPTRLIHAARNLFLKYGFRRTSMDDVAKEADVAKGTLYLAFSSKEDLLRGACADLCDELMAAATEAAQGAESPIERMRIRLETKYARVHELVHLSPHAAELLHSKDVIAEEIVKKSEVAFRRLVMVDLEEAAAAQLIDLKRFSVETSQVAGTLMRLAASCSLADEGATAPTVGVFKKRLQLGLTIFLAGLGMRAPQ